jgi:radical SAM protein with 4Fe4S-binding SPASM domain
MKNLLVKQCDTTFIRVYEDVGYITSQLTRYDRNYNETGAVFLSRISRKAKSIETIVDEILPVFGDSISKKDLIEDFFEFAQELEESLFIVTGKSIEELDKKEPVFSYSSVNPKTILRDYIQRENDTSLDTSVYMMEKIKNRKTVFRIEVEVTARCNEKCIHCYIPVSKKENGNHIDTSLLFKVMDEANESGVLGLTLSGGEFFLHPDYDKILKYAKKKDFMITILSNLTNITEEKIALLKEINPSLIQVSLYSMNPIEHELITQLTGSFVKTKTAIEKLVQADIPVQISCPIMKTNKNSYIDVLKYAESLKTKAQCDYVMMAQTDFDSSNLKERLSSKEMEILISDIVEFDKDYVEQTLAQEPKSRNIEELKNQPVCGIGIDNLCLGADGNFYPCPGFQGYKLGNAHDQTIEEVLNTEKSIFLRNITLNNFPKCLECKDIDYCTICLVRNFNESKGDMFVLNEKHCESVALNRCIVERRKYQSLPNKSENII